MPAEHDGFQALLARVHQGSEEALDQLITRYGHHVRDVVRKRLNPRLRPYFDSEDFVQDAWGSVIRTSAELDRIKRPSDLVAFVSSIARNKVIDQWRKLGTKKNPAGCQSDPREIEKATPLLGAPVAPTASQFAVAHERWDGIMEGASDEERQMVQMRLQGATHEEIAAKLGICQRTVSRAMKRLFGDPDEKRAGDADPSESVNEQPG